MNQENNTVQPRVYKSSEKQREANKRYLEKMRGTPEYRERVRINCQKWKSTHREQYNEYQRNLEKRLYHEKKGEVIKNKFIENELTVLLPQLTI